MGTSQLIDYYVTDVTNRLPRTIRDDVRFELKSLLTEELRAKCAQQAENDATQLCLELLQGFGHPAQVAARYRPPVTIIDPVDSHNFVFAAIAGVAVICLAGFADTLQQASGTDLQWLLVLRDWWISSVMYAFWWPGFLVVFFAIAARVRKRWPHFMLWQPMKVIVKDPDKINRAGWSLIVVLFITGLFVMSQPTRIIELFFADIASPATYAAFSYAPEFYPTGAYWLFGIIAGNLLIYIPLIVQGRWTPMLRRADMILAVVACFAMVWFSASGRIFAATSTDQLVKLAISLIVFFTLLEKGMGLYRELQRSYSPDFSH